MSHGSAVLLVMWPVVRYLWHYVITSRMWHIHIMLQIALLIIKNPALSTYLQWQHWNEGLFPEVLSLQLPECFSMLSLSQMDWPSRMLTFIFHLITILLPFALAQRTCWKMLHGFFLIIICSVLCFSTKLNKVICTMRFLKKLLNTEVYYLMEKITLKLS